MERSQICALQDSPSFCQSWREGRSTWALPSAWPRPPPGCLGEGQEWDLRSKTSCFILLFARNQNHRLCLVLLLHCSRIPPQDPPGVRTEQGIDP